MRRVGERSEVEQDEGQLERPPPGVRILAGRSVDLGPVLVQDLKQIPSVAVPSGADGVGPQALFRHRPVGEPERLERVGTVDEKADPFSDGVSDKTGLVRARPRQPRGGTKVSGPKSSLLASSASHDA